MTTDDDLIKALKETTNVVQAYLKHREMEILLNTYIAADLSDFHQAVESIKSAMEAHEIFKESTVGFFGRKQVIFAPNYQAANLAVMAANRTAEEALAWYHKVIQIKHADLTYFAYVLPVIIDKKWKFSNGVTLVPESEFPDFDRLNAIKRRNRLTPNVSTGRMDIAVIAMVEERGIELSDGLNDTRPEAIDTISRTVNACSLGENGAAGIGSWWIEFNDKDLQATEFGKMTGGGLSDIGLDTYSVLTMDDETKDWVEKYLALPEAVRAHCDLPIERLGTARRRNSPGNAALEGGICLEALLGDESPSDLTHKVSTRCAILLEETLENRKHIKQSVKKFYSLRSKTAHGRRSNSTQNIQSMREISLEGLKICLRSIRRVIEHKRIPNVEKMELT